MKERIAWWDNIRFMLITLVVVGHFADKFTAQSDVFKGIFLFIYTFHMPLFVLISGRLHSNRRITDKCLFYVGVGFLLKAVLYICRKAIGGAPAFFLLSDADLPWYLFAMVAYILITYLLREQSKWFVLLLSILIACFAGLDSTVGDTLYLSRIVVFFPFYWGGTMLNTEGLLRIKKQKWIIALAVLLVCAWGILCLIFTDNLYLLRHLFTGRNPYSSAIIQYGPWVRLFCYALSLIVSLSVMMLIPARRIAAITVMGERSLHVYFWHWPAFLLLNHFLRINEVFYWGNNIGKVLYLLLAGALAVVLSQKFASYPLEWVRKLCNKK